MKNEYAPIGPPAPRAGADKLAESMPRLLALRMRGDLRLAIVTLYTLCVAATVGPFAVYRLMTGELLVGAVDLGIVAVFMVLAALAWQPKRTRLAANVTAGVAAAAVAGVVVILGLSPYWLFSTLVGNFLMAERRVALSVNAAMVGVIAINPGISPSVTEHATLVAVAVMTSLFSLIFAARVSTQHEELSRLAERDGLTGAFNRRSLDHDLENLVESAARSGEVHSLALIDLDDFKALNDELGHEAGDQALTRLSTVADASTREKDRFYRYGGEEFVLVLPSTPLDGADKALANLREAHTAASEPGTDRVTFSAGVAEHLPGESASDWLARADRALFRAKRNGKNRIETA